MKFDRQSRLPTVPETASLLGKDGGEAEGGRTFAAGEPPPPQRTWPYVLGFLALGLLVMHLLGALPIGNSSRLWIRSLPKARNPAAQLPGPQPPIAAAIQLESGTDAQSSVGGSDASSSKPDNDSSAAGGPKLDSAADSLLAAAADKDAAAFDAVQAAKDAEEKGKAAPAGEAAKDTAETREEVEASAQSSSESSSSESEAAAAVDALEEATPATGAAEASPSVSAGDRAGSGGESSSQDADSKDQSQKPAGGSDPRSGSSSSKSGQPAAAATADDAAGTPSSSIAEPSSQAGESKAGGGQDSSDDARGSGLSRVSALDEAALLADGEAKEAVPDRPPAEGGDTEASAAMDSDGSIVAPDDGAQLLAAADSDEPAAPGKAEAGNGSGGSSSGSSKVTTDSKARTKAAEQREAGKHQAAGASSGKGSKAGGSTQNTAAEQASGGAGESSGNTAANPQRSSSGGGSRGGASKDSGASSTNSNKGGGDASEQASASEQPSGGQGTKKRAGRKEAARARVNLRSERTALATQAGSKDKGAAAAEGCLAFAAAGCQVIPGQKEPLQYSKCEDPPYHKTKDGPDCSFDLAETLKPCPIPGAGLYFEHERKQPECKVPPFWRERGSQPPSCATNGVCCSGDGLKGAWQEAAAADKDYHMLEFKPDKAMGCKFQEYTRRQVLGCLTNTTVVLWGDSMMRQVFSRVPSLFRGEIRSYDPQRWRAERYDACEAADVRTQAPPFDGLSPKDPHYQLWGLAELTDTDHPFFSFDKASVPQTELVDIVDPNAQPKDFPAQTCGETRPASFQYLPATGFQPQYRFMGFYTKYVNTDLSQGVFVSQVGFWDEESTEPEQRYLQALQEVLDKGLKQLIIITVPTSLVGVDENDPRRPLFRGRNDFMRRWAANETSGRTSILDMDYLSLAPDAPTGLLGNWTDWHYQCKFHWYNEHPERNMSATEFAPHSHNWLDPAGWTLGGLQANVRRDCIDDMNRVVVQMLFNMMCNSRD